MQDDRPASTPPYASPSGDGEGKLQGHAAVQTDHVSHRAVDSADDKPVSHGTPHEVAGSPVRSPKDFEGDGSPGTSNEATKRLPP